MEKVIEIDINDKYDLVNKYNEEKLSNELLEYILKQAMAVDKNRKIKIIIDKKCYIDESIDKLIKEGLKEEYNRSLLERDKNNNKQFFFLLIGMFFIFLSTQIGGSGIWKEIFLISGWVPIWEMIEVELFPDAYGRRKRKIINKLLKSEIIEKNIKDIV